jgi:hypothetical protein
MDVTSLVNLEDQSLVLFDTQLLPDSGWQDHATAPIYAYLVTVGHDVISSF